VTTSREGYRDFLAAALLGLDGVTTRRMFGCDGFFTRAKLFAFLTDTALVTKVPEAERARVLEAKGARPFRVSARVRFGRWIEVPLRDGTAVRRALRLARIAHRTIDGGDGEPRARVSRRRRSLGRR
jgi:TfoX/Sxy family transcriptional regulator of competence genes